MPDKNKLMVIAVAISLFGTASLYIYTASRDVVRVSISDMGMDLIGVKVETHGVVSEARHLKSSSLLSLREEESDGILAVYIEGQVMDVLHEPGELRPGAKVRLRGVLEEYAGELSLRISVPGELVIIERAYSSFTDIACILDKPEWYSGMDLKVRGKVVHISPSWRGTFFEIESLNGGFQRLGCEMTDVNLTVGNNIVSGTTLVFRGTFGYDRGTGRWMLTGSEPPDVM